MKIWDGWIDTPTGKLIEPLCSEIVWGCKNLFCLINFLFSIILIIYYIIHYLTNNIKKYWKKTLIF